MMPHRALTPEARLLFRSADPAATAESLAPFAAQVTDWARALTVAEIEGATPALKRAFKGTEGIIHRDVQQFLKMRAAVSDFRMMQLSQRTQETVRRLAQAGVPVILLKGAGTSALTDPTFCLRPMGDVDLLVHSAETLRAQNAVLDAGWSVTKDPVVVALLQDQHHLPHFVRDDLPGLRLELHTMLLPPDHSFAIDESVLWRDARPAPAPFEGALVLSPVHQALHASIHFAWQHQLHFGAWRTMRSLATAVAQPHFSWEGLEREARAARAVTAVYWTLRMARTLCGLAIPEATLARLAPPTNKRVMNGLERHFIATIVDGEGPTSPSIKLSRRLWLMAIRPKWSGLARAGRTDPLRRWDRAYGRENREGRLRRVSRHLSGYKTWWAFVTHTLIGL